MSPLSVTSSTLSNYSRMWVILLHQGIWRSATLYLHRIGWHELCHIAAVRPCRVSLHVLVAETRWQAILSGGRILKITIDPHVGGATIVEGGSPGFTLSAGYIGSTLLGGVFVLAGWDTLVAKVLSFVLGVGLVLPLVLVRDKLYEPLMFFPWHYTLNSTKHNSFNGFIWRSIDWLLVCWPWVSFLVGFQW